jgi:ATP-dependent DNA helicase DinG
VIAPRTEREESPFSSSIRERVGDFFRPGGVLEKACAGEEFPFEPRPQQAQMAEAVAGAIEDSRHLIVEAGTGVGKSFAYLVPAILTALERQIQIVISTYTISLQEQLIAKDIPFLQKHLKEPFKAVLVKGRSNYLCLRRLYRSSRHQGELFQSETELELQRIRDWAEHTTDGSLQDMPEQPSQEAWSAVCAEHGNCLGPKCADRKRCFLMRARSHMRDAHIIVVNHHLFFSELALRGQGAAFLPPYSVAIMDEAHMIEGVASEHMGLRLSHYSFDHWLRRLYVPENSKGLLSALREGEAAHEVTKIWEEVDRYYGEVRKWAHFDREGGQRVVTSPMGLETTLPDLLNRLLKALEDVIRKTKDPDLRSELKAIQTHGCGMKDALEAFMKQAMPDQVYWVESEGRKRQQIVLYSAPIEIAPVMEKMFFEQLECTVLTSATLAVRGELDYFRQRIGGGECETLCLGSPFDYSRQMKIFIPQNMPDPNESETFATASARVIRHFVRQTHGQAFVLFTSANQMKLVAKQLDDFFEEEGLRLLMQGAGMPRHVMLEQFRRGPSCVLFGLDSFWMGVDVRGEALSNVIIARLPFAVPDHPVVKARMDRIREKGGDPFKDYSLPEAILKFRQGVGRLIRTATDEGIVVVLDTRIATKWYGKLFLASIPECPVEVVDV